MPDFDPNNPKEAHDPDRINRLTTGVFEMGSTFKALTLAMALDSGKATLNSLYDGRGALKFGKFTIHDTHPVGRAITTSMPVDAAASRATASPSTFVTW